jgi:hypothetical protein
MTQISQAKIKKYLRDLRNLRKKTSRPADVAVDGDLDQGVGHLLGGVVAAFLEQAINKLLTQLDELTLSQGGLDAPLGFE